MLRLLPASLTVAFLLPCAAMAAAEATDPRTIRVLTYNIHHGEGVDGKIDLERIAAIIRDSGADIVALQEVDRGVTRTQGRDLPAEFAKLTGMQVYFEKNIPYQGGEYGNAVLTRFPIKSKKNTHLRMVGQKEQRGVLQLVLDVNGRDVLFMDTHLDARRDDAERVVSTDELKPIVDAAGAMPVVLCGDFNATPGSRTHTKMKVFLADAWELVGQGPGNSIPSLKPTKRIDYMWITAKSIEPVRMSVISSEASDHAAVFGEFRLR